MICEGQSPYRVSLFVGGSDLNEIAHPIVSETLKSLNI